MALIPYIVIFVAVAGAWLVIDRKCWTTACHEQQVRAVVAEAAIAAAVQRATDLALLWAKSIEKVEVHYVEVEKVRTVRFETIRERAGKIELAACPIPNDAAVLLRDITAAANTPSAAALAGPGAAPEAPVPESADWLAYSRQAGEAFREQADARLECIERYNTMRDGIIKAQGP